jgi:hypothetical protein
MDHPAEKPACVQRAEATVPARKRNSLQHKLKAWTENELAHERMEGKHSRRRPKPSMPTLPWDKSE